MAKGRHRLPATPLPLVVGLHGYYGTGQGFGNDTAEMFDHLNANNYIGVFPTGEESSPGSGVTSLPCGPDSKVSLFQIYGSRDNTLRGDGEPGSDGMIYDAAAEAAQEWAIVQGCDTQATASATASDGKKD